MQDLYPEEHFFEHTSSIVSEKRDYPTVDQKVELENRKFFLKKLRIGLYWTEVNFTGILLSHHALVAMSNMLSHLISLEAHRNTANHGAHNSPLRTIPPLPSSNEIQTIEPIFESEFRKGGIACPQPFQEVVKKKEEVTNKKWGIQSYTVCPK